MNHLSPAGGFPPRDSHRSRTILPAVTCRFVCNKKNPLKSTLKLIIHYNCLFVWDFSLHMVLKQLIFVWTSQKNWGFLVSRNVCMETFLPPHYGKMNELCSKNNATFCLLRELEMTGLHENLFYWLCPTRRKACKKVFNQCRLIEFLRKEK